MARVRKEMEVSELRMRERTLREAYEAAVKRQEGGGGGEEEGGDGGSEASRVAAPPPTEKKSDLHCLGCERLAAMKPQGKKHTRKGNCKKAPLAGCRYR
jgi:hypothetical protein